MMGRKTPAEETCRGKIKGLQRNTIPVIFQGLAGTFYGVTATGFVGFLWPLAHLNHWFVGRVARCHLQPLQGPDHPGR